MVEAYCMRCRKKVEMKNPVTTKTKKGVPMSKGECSICGTRICRIGG